MKKTTIGLLGLLLIFLANLQRAQAQLSLSALLRTRSEFRDGQGSPLPQPAKPAFFTSQRTRLTLGYSAYRIKLALAVQDVRVWGQDVSTINRTTTADNNGLMLHEAWAEIFLTDTTIKNKVVSLKLGRQELVYDDSRLIGNLDWLQQARRHDAALLKYETKDWMIHLAGAFNQNKENLSGTTYNSSPAGNYAANTNAGSMYKSMQFLYASRKWNTGNISSLFFADQFSRFRNDSINTAVKIYEPGSWNRFTTGIYFVQNWKSFSFTGSAYYQFGHYDAQKRLSATLLSGTIQYAFTKKWSAAAGIDYTSGGGSSSTSHAFDPLYGTPHKFWGLMDYFYAGTPFGKTGLVDYYFKSKWKASELLSLSADYHHFNSASAVNSAGNKRNFGDEIDVVGSVFITKMISVEAGYSHFFSTPLLTAPAVKNIPNADAGSNWAYVMVNIKPALLFK